MNDPHRVNDESAAWRKKIGEIEVEPVVFKEIEDLADYYKQATKDREVNYKKVLSEKEKILEKNKHDIRRLLIENAFASSDFVKGKLTIPPSMAYETFGKYFSVEEVSGRPVAVARDANGVRSFPQAIRVSRTMRLNPSRPWS